MRITLHILLFILLIPFVGYTQDRAACKSIVEQFYAMLYKDAVTIKEFEKVYSSASLNNDVSIFLDDSLRRPHSGLMKMNREARVNPDTTPSYIFKKVKKYFPVLTQGLLLPEIRNVIETGRMYEEGVCFTKYFEITFSNGDYICFELSKKPLVAIVDIWLPSGRSLHALTRSVEYEFKRPGIINDPDGYVNIREKADKNAEIVGRLKQNEVFYYIPTNISDWWLIYNENDDDMGFIHKSRIVQYKDFPKKLKHKVDQQRGGC